MNGARGCERAGLTCAPDEVEVIGRDEVAGRDDPAVLGCRVEEDDGLDGADVGGGGWDVMPYEERVSEKESYATSKTSGFVRQVEPVCNHPVVSSMWCVVDS